MSGEGMVSGTSCKIENDQRPDLRMFAYRVANTGAVTTVACTGLSKVLCVVATQDDDCADAEVYASASIGDQAGSPAAGSVYVKLWKLTSGTDPTPAAADDTGVYINVLAVGY
jgi:hypothetical protein